MAREQKIECPELNNCLIDFGGTLKQVYINANCGTLIFFQGPKARRLFGLNSHIFMD